MSDACLISICSDLLKTVTPPENYSVNTDDVERDLNLFHPISCRIRNLIVGYLFGRRE